MATYSIDTLESVARLSSNWDSKYFSDQSSPVESFLRKEFHLLLQYLFINEVPDPLNPEQALLQKWLDFSVGLDVHSIRNLILKRLYHLTQNQRFLMTQLEETERVVYPDLHHLVNWRDYHWKIFNRSRSYFDNITTDKIIEAELKTIPFYKALELAAASDRRQMTKAGNSRKLAVNVFEESHMRVAEILLDKLRDYRAHNLKILEVGCGNGLLLQILRNYFPNAEIIGTNLSGSEIVIPQVLKDPNTCIISYSLENLPFASESFDVFISTEVIEHLVRPQTMVEQIKRLLKPNGVFVVTAPSVHVQFLSKNPFTYLTGLLSTFLDWDWLLPPFHNLYEPLTDLSLIHYAFSIQQYRNMFLKIFPNVKVSTMRFFHLRKFRLDDRTAAQIPIFKKFGGLLIAHN